MTMTPTESARSGLGGVGRGWVGEFFCFTVKGEASLLP
jgi:hypothetical protein